VAEDEGQIWVDGADAGTEPAVRHTLKPYWRMRQMNKAA
jgi:hypothetical protein